MKLRHATQHGGYAGFASRGFAFAIDAAVIAVGIAGTSWFVAAILNSILVDPENCPPVSGWGDLRAILCRYSHIPGPVAALGFPVVYRILFWWTASKTPGMAMMGLQLARLNGEAMTFVTALRRLVGYGLSLFLGGLGFLTILATDRRQALPDRLAGTVVLNARPARAEPLLARAFAKTRLLAPPKTRASDAPSDR